MPARFARLIIAAAIVLLVAALTAPPIPAANEKAGPIVVDGWEVVGNEVLVQVTNLSSERGSAVVGVRAVSAGMPMRNTVRVSVPAGGTQGAAVRFIAPVEGVIVVGISETPDPMG